MFRVTRHGFREMLIGSVALVLTAFILGYFAWWWLALLLVPGLVWLFAFFRDPERVVPDEQHAMVSPPTGTVSDITEIEKDQRLGRRRDPRERKRPAARRPLRARRDLPVRLQRPRQPQPLRRARGKGDLQ